MSFHIRIRSDLDADANIVPHWRQYHTFGEFDAEQVVIQRAGVTRRVAHWCVEHWRVRGVQVTKVSAGKLWFILSSPSEIKENHCHSEA